MILSDNPRLALFQLQNQAETTINNVSSFNQKISEEIDNFKKSKETTLIINESLKIEVRFPNNDVVYTISTLKIIAAPWTNGHKDGSLDCKIKLKLALLFTNHNGPNRWESSLYGVELLPNQMILRNAENVANDLEAKTPSDFEQLSGLIKNGINQIGMNYPI